MNKREFSHLKKYISANPQEAVSLFTAIMEGINQSQGDLGSMIAAFFHPRHISNLSSIAPSEVGVDEWVTPSEAGRHIGRSRNWIKERMQYLPPGCIKIVAHGRRNDWSINLTKTKLQLINIKNNEVNRQN